MSKRKTRIFRTNDQKKDLISQFDTLKVEGKSNDQIKRKLKVNVNQIYKWRNENESALEILGINLKPIKEKKAQHLNQDLVILKDINDKLEVEIIRYKTLKEEAERIMNL